MYKFVALLCLSLLLVFLSFCAEKEYHDPSLCNGQKCPLGGQICNNGKCECPEGTFEFLDYCKKTDSTYYKAIDTSCFCVKELWLTIQKSDTAEETYFDYEFYSKKGVYFNTVARYIKTVNGDSISSYFPFPFYCYRKGIKCRASFRMKFVSEDSIATKFLWAKIGTDKDYVDSCEFYFVKPKR